MLLALFSLEGDESVPWKKLDFYEYRTKAQREISQNVGMGSIGVDVQDYVEIYVKVRGTLALFDVYW